MRPAIRLCVTAGVPSQQPDEKGCIALAWTTQGGRTRNVVAFVEKSLRLRKRRMLPEVPLAPTKKMLRKARSR